MIDILAIILIALSCRLPFQTAGGEFAQSAGATYESAQTIAITDEFRSFLAIREAGSALRVNENSGGYEFILNNGRLRVVGTDNTEIWRSKDGWYVDSFRVGDVNRDQILDFAFVLWKSYSFGTAAPARIANDDASVRCHLFVYSVKDDMVKQLWCSSNLPRPIYSFELETDGIRTPTLSGTRLITQEGAYTGDYGITASSEYIYAWNGWGFSPLSP